MSEKRPRGRPHGIPNPGTGRPATLQAQFDEPLVTLPTVQVPESYRQYLLDEFGTIAGGIRALIEYHRESELAKRLDSADE